MWNIQICIDQYSIKMSSVFLHTKPMTADYLHVCVYVTTSGNTGSAGGWSLEVQIFAPMVKNSVTDKELRNTENGIQ